jgi:hypothetical protein
MGCQHSRCPHRGAHRGPHPAPEDPSDLFGAHAARSQDRHLALLEGDDGRLDAHLARTTVHDQPDSAGEPAAHVASARGAHTPEPVGRRSGKPSAEALEDALDDRMGGNAQRHGVQAAGDRVENRRVPIEDHRERTGPERFGQPGRLLRDASCPVGEVCSAAQVHDQGMVGRTALGCEHARNGLGVRRVGGKAVDRLCGHRDQLTGPQHADREPDRPVAATDHPGSITAAENRVAPSAPLLIRADLHANTATARWPIASHQPRHSATSPLELHPSVSGALNCRSAACLSARTCTWLR